MDGTAPLPPPSPPHSPNFDRIRDAAMACCAATGVAATSLRAVAESAEVSLGLVQHYFPAKADLIAAVDDHVLRVFGAMVKTTSESASTADNAGELGSQMARLVYENRVAMDYVAHALIEGDRIGAVVFDELLQMSAAQREMFAARGMTRPDLDPLWAALNPLILRLSAIILRSHIDRHLSAPMFSPAQLQLWDTEASLLIRHGQMPETGPAEH